MSLFQKNDILLLASLLALSCQNAIADNAYIEKNIKQYAYNTFKKDKPVITVKTIDPRLKLSPCKKKLNIKWNTEAKAGKNLIKASCNSNKPWKIYVPVTVDIYKYIVVAKNGITKGEALTKLNTYKKKHNIGKLYRGYIENINAYTSRKAKRNIRKDEVIHNGLFSIKYTVQRGQELILETNNNNIAVRMTGIALSNGQKGDLIKVRNKSSSKIIEAIIKDKGKAIVLN